MMLHRLLMCLVLLAVPAQADEDDATFMVQGLKPDFAVQRATAAMEHCREQG